MELEQLEVYSREANYAVIKPPGRSYPGRVIQGDSLGILCRMAKHIAESVRHGETTDEEFLGNVEQLANSLIGRMLHYQQVLSAHGIDFPHVWPFSESDLVKLVPDKADE